MTTWRRRARRIAAWLLGPPLVLLAGVAGTLIALIHTPPGRAATLRLGLDFMVERVAGTLEIGELRGNILGHVVLEDVAVHDSVGGLLLRAPRLDVRYSLLRLVRGQIVLDELRLERPEIRIERLTNDRWNYQEIFRSGTGDGGDSDSEPALIELHNVVVRQGELTVLVPTVPGPPKQPISRQGAEPAQQEIVETSDGPKRVYRAHALSGRFPVVRVSTPDDEPIRVVIDSLSTRMSDPAVTVVDLRGEVITKADSLRFEIADARLPGSRLNGSGAVRWPAGDMLFDFTIHADTVALRDLLWIQPDFPDWAGKGTAIANSTSGSRTEYTLQDLILGGQGATAAGQLVAITDEQRGFGVRNLDLALRAVPLAVMAPYLDTMPFAGELTGRIQAGGFIERMTLAGELDFADASVAGSPVSNFNFAGDLIFGGEAGATFDAFQLRNTVVDLATVEAIIPAVAVPGDLRLVGRLDGPWQDVTFVGITEHLAPNSAMSRMTGTVAFDTRSEVLGLGLDVFFDQLSFDALRTGWPDLPMRGGITGSVVAEGSLESLWLDADVNGEIGTVRATGTVAIVPPRMAADSLSLDFQRLDFDALMGQGTMTALNGRMVLDGVMDSAMSPIGTVALDLNSSRIGGLTVDGMIGRVTSDGSILRLDSLLATWPDATVLADGAIGWTAPDSAELKFSIAATSLVAFDSLVRATFDLAPDSLEPRALDGVARLEGTVSGSLDDALIVATLDAQELELDRLQAVALHAELRADSMGATGFAVDLTTDSLRFGEYLVQQLELVASGVPDSMRLATHGQIGEATVALAGEYISSGTTRQFGLDTLQLDLPRQKWRLSEPATVTMTDSRITLQDSLVIRSQDGSGLIAVSGDIPGNAPGELGIQIVALDLADVYAVLQQDTSQVGGLASLDARLGGTRSAPTLRGNAIVTGPVFREVRPPLVRMVFDYNEQLLRGRVSLWRTGEPILEADVALPYDLALTGRTNRMLPGPISIQVLADSADLSILEAFTTAVRDTRGTISINMGATGTWERPELTGEMTITEGRMTIPALYVRYGPIDGRATFSGDSMVVDSMRLSSGEGDLLVDGLIHFENLDRAMLDLDLVSSGFLVMDVPDVMRLRPTGRVSLSGLLSNPVLSGTSLRVDNSDLYFADLLYKDVINLEDPLVADLVDQDELRRSNLGAGFQNRFLDSLRIENLPFVVGNNVWLRSSEANVQLEGSVNVSKAGQEYRVVGTLNAVRGDYTLNFGNVVSRTFTVENGTVRFYGTPDLDADLDITARYLARAVDGDEIPVVAHITGSIQVPEVELSSPGRDIAAADLVSYLMFGRPDFQMEGFAEAQAVQSAMGILSNEVQRAVTSSGLGIDLFEFRPAVAPGQAGNGTFARFVLGWQLGPRWFVTVNAGFCLGGQDVDAGFSARNFGASLEYRFARDWRAQASAEPIGNCIGSRLSDAFTGLSRNYQFGADLLWEREY